MEHIYPPVFDSYYVVKRAKLNHKTLKLNAKTVKLSPKTLDTNSEILKLNPKTLKSGS